MARRKTVDVEGASTEANGAEGLDAVKAGGAGSKAAVAGAPAASEPRLEYWSVDRLKAHPLNWRTHPARQRAALDGVMDQVGYAGVVIVNERTGHIIDGHLRYERAMDRPGEKVPVLLFDLDEAAEALALATHDTLARWATGDAEKFGGLAASARGEFDGLADEVADVMREVQAELTGQDERAARAASATVSGWWVSIACKNEAEQKRVYELMQREGRQCRILSV